MHTLSDLTILYFALILVFCGFLLTMSTRRLQSAEYALERKEITGYQLITCRSIIVIELFYFVRYAVLLAASVVTGWDALNEFQIQYSGYFLAIVWVLAVAACSLVNTFIEHYADSRCWSCGHQEERED